MDVHVKFVDSRSNGSRDSRAAHFVIDDDERRRRPTDPGVIGQNGVLSKNHIVVGLMC